MCRRKRPAYECAERLRADLRPELCHGNGYAAFVPVRVILPVDVLVTLRQLRRSRSEGRSYIHHRDACLAQAAFELSEQDVALGKELSLGMEPLMAGPLEVKYIPLSGHWVQQEQPQVVNGYLLDFLGDAARERAPAAV